ncbi:Clavaminate synthase-like protein [Zopfia rhizophila CBS 207.26]|uniref:Clavaminate synthase-like protein n=1 Tax=Zopfia rhizophila CBS 207.26 TaxID=1314779 RepID=A0A6A6EFY2_9PEZI|nr:Clavaminate synthase-like protein [Zopfia rhizophila CBS 207.26]
MKIRPLLRYTHLIYRSYSTSKRFPLVRAIESNALDSFRSDQPSPIILRNCFGSIPAIPKWFIPSKDGSSSPALNLPYLEQHGTTIVPLELTRLRSSSRGAPQVSTFESFEAPFSLFLSFISTSRDPSTRLYLAQCSLDDLPTQLRADLQTPDLISQAGKGDIYASSLWLGRPPTRTPLHRDPNPNLFVQLAGQKVVRLMTPDIGRQVYERARAGRGHANMRGEEMMAGEEMERLEEAVWGDGVEAEECGWEARLGGGDGLYIPLGWWHSVRGIGKGVTGSVNWWFR